jgi:hypothetical protein
MGGWPFTVGAIWGLLSPVIHIAMTGVSLPAPSLDPLGILRVAVDLPFIMAAGVEVAVGRPSPSLQEMALVGMVVGALTLWIPYRLFLFVRRRMRRW